ncbi:hypothetical protein, partial [Nostoc sp. CALU 1950]|uniref:hypothetical protein n=1 Tax=Nostoc sp. CALU 1950 TaxID=3104321 RepID=UPI003EBCC2AF
MCHRYSSPLFLCALLYETLRERVLGGLSLYPQGRVRLKFFDENSRSQRRDESPSLPKTDYCRDGDS